MTYRDNTTNATPEAHLTAGIDVGSEELVLCIRKNHKSFDVKTYKNTPSDHRALVNKFKKTPGIIVCLEATGVYYFDLTLALHDAGIKIMAINPKVSHNFAKVLKQNSKTDKVDAETLAVYAERMDFIPWERPADEKISLRFYSRRILALTKQKAVNKNHLHALSATKATPKELIEDLNEAIEQLEVRIAKLSKEARLFIKAYPELDQKLEMLVEIKGIAYTSAISLLGELLMLPPNLSHKEWVKFAGLDPKAFESGKSVHRQARISKAGNKYIRAALYMPAMSASIHDKHIKAYYEHLKTMGKTPLQAYCAVMRKLLHAIHGMFKHNKPFDNTRFYAIPEVDGMA